MNAVNERYDKLSLYMIFLKILICLIKTKRLIMDTI